jgi:hypothetical protein
VSTSRTESLTNDISMQNTWTSIGSTRNGTGIFSNSGASATSQFNSLGQAKGGPGLTSADYQTCLSYFRFQGWAVPSNELLVSAWLDFRHSYVAGTVTRVLEYREFDFGGSPDPGTGGPNSPTPGDWVDTTALEGLDLMATVPGINQSTMIAFSPYFAGGTGLYERAVAGPTALDIVGTTDRVSQLIAPGSDERVGMYFANYGTSAFRPNLHLSSISDSTLLRHGGASAQLSDGTSVFVEDFELMYSTDNVTDNAIASLATGTGTNQFDNDVVAWQLLSIAVDASDNIWIVGKGGAGAGALVAQGFLKGAGYSWTAQPARQITAPAYGANTDVPINNVAATWHPTTNAGSLMVMTSRRAGAGKSGQVAYAVLSCNNLLAGVNPVLASGVNPPWLGLSTPTDDGVRYANDTGNGLDVHANGLIGHAICWDGTTYTGLAYPQIRAGRYILTPTGTLHSSTPWDEDDTPIELQPETKAKIVMCGGSRIALCYGDRIHVYDTSGSRIVEGATVGPVLYEKANIDWLFDPVGDVIHLYYFSSALVLKRTAFSLATGTFAAAVTVSGAVGADGTNPALRLPRGITNERTVRIEVGHRSAGGALSTIVLNDTLNVPPTAPVVTDRTTFNADNPAVFAWTFSDPNTDDAQTARQVQIFRTSDNAIVHDTGKVASAVASYTLPPSTLINNEAYYWKVRVWDLADAVSAYSATDAFTTVSTAITTITVPAADNPPDAVTSSYQISWATTVIVQAKYKVRVVNDQTGALVLDTGFVTGTETTFLLTGLQDGIKYRVEVTVRSNVDVEAIPGVRFITPDYIEPLAPMLTVTPIDTYNLVSVVNPSSGNEPVTLQNPGFEVDAAGWVGSNVASPVARVTSPVRSGTGAGRMVPNGVAAQASIDQTSAGSATPIEVGETYTLGVWVRSDTGYAEVSCSILWRNSVPATITTVDGVPIAIPAGVWTLITVTGTAPGGAVAALLRVRETNTPPSSAVLYIDDVDFRTAAGAEPEVLRNALYRAPGAVDLDTGEFDRIGELGNNGSYRDYAVASGREYTYYVDPIV